MRIGLHYFLEYLDEINTKKILRHIFIFLSFVGTVQLVANWLLDSYDKDVM